MVRLQGLEGVVNMCVCVCDLCGTCFVCVCDLYVGSWCVCVYGQREMNVSLSVLSKLFLWAVERISSAFPQNASLFPCSSK